MKWVEWKLSRLLTNSVTEKIIDFHKDKLNPGRQVEHETTQ